MQKFSDILKDPLQSENIHIVTDDLEMPWEILGNDEEPICLKYSCGISPLKKRDQLGSSKKVQRLISVAFAKHANISVIVYWMQAFYTFSPELLFKPM